MGRNSRARHACDCEFFFHTCFANTLPSRQCKPHNSRNELQGPFQCPTIASTDAGVHGCQTQTCRHQFAHQLKLYLRLHEQTGYSQTTLPEMKTSQAVKPGLQLRSCEAQFAIWCTLQRKVTTEHVPCSTAVAPSSLTLTGAAPPLAAEVGSSLRSMLSRRKMSVSSASSVSRSTSHASTASMTGVSSPTTCAHGTCNHDDMFT